MPTEPLTYETDERGAWTWLVWAFSVEKGVNLTAICSTEAKAEDTQQRVGSLYPGARFHIERAPVDHTFGASDLRSVAYRAALKSARQSKAD